MHSANFRFDQFWREHQAASTASQSRRAENWQLCRHNVSYAESNRSVPAKRRCEEASKRSRRDSCLVSAHVLASELASSGQSAETNATEALEAEMPCLAGGGGGIFFFWQLGVIKYLFQHFEAEKMQFVGASAGALVATLAACEVDPDLAVESAYRISKEARLWDRKLGLLGIWGGLIRQWLDEILPADAYQRCRGRLKLIGTDVRARKQVYIPGIETREDIVQANLCSIHIPFFLDLRPFQSFKGVSFVDGSLTDFLFWENGALLTREGRSFVLDYSQDTELKFKRLDFVKLRSYESVLELMEQGFRYAAREDSAGGFDRLFGHIRSQRRS